MQHIKLQKEPITSAKMKAFSYQTAAVEAIKDLAYAAVFHEQGLGKSKIVIDLMLYWLKEKIVDTVIIVTKKSLIHNWQDELAIHTYLNPKVLSTDKNKNYYIFNGSSRVILCNFEVLISEKSRIALFQRTRSVAVIVDESAKIKNPDSTITRTMFELSDGFAKRVIMTGTPVANRPYDIWAQIFFLDHGVSLGENFREFKKNADLSNDLSENIEARDAFETCIREIYHRIDAFSVRETKASGIIHLPEKQYDNIYTGWEQHQHDLYDQIRNELRAYIIRDNHAVIDESDAILKRLLRLVQAASNPLLIDEAYDQVPGKFLALQNLLSVIDQTSEKAIIWTCFTDNVDWLARELINYHAVRVHGKMNMEDRNRSIQRFKSDETVKVLVATPASAKEGLTLTVANHVVFFDRGFSLDDYLQAQDRIHRISQDKTCFIHNLIMRDSIDEWVDVLLESKHTAAQLAQGDIDFVKYKDKMEYDFGDIVREVLSNENN